MLIEELNGMESATVDVEVDIPAVEIRGAGFPHFYLWMHILYGFPDGLANPFALNAHFHIEECKLTYGLPLSRLGRADASIALLSLLHRFTHSAISSNDGTTYTLAILADGLVGFGTFCL